MKRIVSVIAAASFFLPALGVAEDRGTASPAQQVQNVCAKAGSVRLATTDGSVLLSRGGSFSQIRDGAELSPGDRILVRDGSANVMIGQNVASKVGAGSMLTITEKDGLVCAAQVSSHPAVVGQGEIFGVSPLFVAGGVAAAVGLGVGLGVGLSDNGDNGQQQRNLALLLLDPVSQ